MRTQYQNANRAFRALLAIAGALIPLTSAASQQRSGRFVDQPAERRISVTLEAADSATRFASEAIEARGASTQLSHDATFHRFHVELLDSAGRPVSGSASWDVTLFATAQLEDGVRGMQPMVRLSTDAPDVRVPRPYGVQVNGGDSLRVVATLRKSGVDGPRALRITIEYESADQPMSRLAVLSLASCEQYSVNVDSSATGTDRTWIWQPTVNGRIVAISGRTLAGATALVLEDETTGEVLWSARSAYPLRGTGSAEDGEVIRPSITVQAGRSYRLSASFSSPTAQVEAMDQETPLAILFPATH